MNIADLYEAACCLDIGGRKEQQDRVEILWSDAACLVVLADGMGGHIDGALAAQTAIDSAREAFEASAQTPAKKLFQKIVTEAHERINGAAQDDLYPSSTLVLLHLTPSTATWTHLGDSRLYRFKNGRYLERTKDHSYPEGGMSACLGAGWQLPRIDVSYADISEGDGFLLCSDGLWEDVNDQQLEAAIAARDMPGALRELVDYVRLHGRGFGDNISVAAVRRGRS